MGDNYLPNGTVLPHGLLGHNTEMNMAGFKKSYQNVQLRVGIIIDSFSVADDGNISGLTTEYNVLVFEQNEDLGSTSILYRNCMSAEGLGNIADFFEKTLRKQTNGNGRETSNAKGQNGAVVLLLCIDGMGDKGIILAQLTHPDRKTTLTSDALHLEGEYNGVNIKINDDGSCSLTFNGPTNDDGSVADPSIGTTTLSIAADGSYSFDNGGVQESFGKKGAVALTAKDSITHTAQTDYSVSAQGGITLTAQKDMNATMNNLMMSAQGSAQINGQNITLQAQSALSVQGSTISIEAQSMANIKGSTIVLDGMVSLGGQGGQPILLLSTILMGVGNLGAPVISTAISGYALKVTGQ